MSERYIHPGRAGFVQAEAERLGVVDTETNNIPVHRAENTKQVGLVEHHVSLSCEPDNDGKPEVKAELLGHCESQIVSLAIAYLASIKMVEAAYVGHGLEVPAWCSVTAIFGQAELVAVAESGEPDPALVASAGKRARGKKQKPDPAIVASTEETESPLDTDSSSVLPESEPDEQSVV